VGRWFDELRRSIDGIVAARRTNRPSKPKLMYLISEDWFFCSHFMERAVAARDAGYDVVVMTREKAHGAKIRAAGLRLLPVNFSRASINPVKEMALLLRICLAYRRERPDVLHHVASKPILYGTLAAIACLRNPAIVNAPVGMGYVFSSEQRLARLLRPFLRLGYRFLLNPRGSRVIFENPDDAGEFVENGFARRGDSVVIRGAGVHLQKFQPASPPPGPPVVALVARMLRDKGVYEFVEAAHRLHDAGSDARFVLVGDSDPENPASIPSEQLRSWHGRKGVEWWGWQEDMVSAWHQVHVACLPSSYREGLPKALLEAAACGLPVVTTDAVGCREVVQHRRNGFLVPVGDVQALADALNVLISDGDLRRRMGKHGRTRAEREFSSERVNRETLAVYRSLASPMGTRNALDVEWGVASGH
jgi:glycosyltransferase involved in cell wall biosynthesis